MKHMEQFRFRSANGLFFFTSKRRTMDKDATESDDSMDASEGFQPKSPAMKRWKKRYIDHEDVDSSTTEEDDESNLNEVV